MRHLDPGFPLPILIESFYYYFFREKKDMKTIIQKYSSPGLVWGLLPYKHWKHPCWSCCIDDVLVLMSLFGDCIFCFSCPREFLCLDSQMLLCLSQRSRPSSVYRLANLLPEQEVVHSFAHLKKCSSSIYSMLPNWTQYVVVLIAMVTLTT